MTPATAVLVEELEAERLRPVPPPPDRYPDGPSARLHELPQAPPSATSIPAHQLRDRPVRTERHP